MALYLDGEKVLPRCDSASDTTFDDTNVAYEADNVQEALEKVTKLITYAEYEALTEEEKKNGTIYFITDVNGDGQSFQPIIYSEEEREIGVWTDGRPVYEKTLNVGAITSGTTFAHGITNLDWIIDYSLFGLYGGEAKLVSPANGSSSSIGFVIVSWDSTNITFTKGNLSSNFSNCYCTIRYTKSTDQAGSGQWTPQGVPAHHYSTNEQIVGTWIDGKTLYEKTFKVDNTSIDTSHETEIADLTALNIETWVGVVHSAGYLQAYDVTVDENRLSIGYKPTSKKLIAGQSYTQQYTTVDILATVRYTKSS